ncbi:hypothetical protein OsI_15800 [Oryza sativa Indica Group]|uniref:Uncharacterized protein n=1 Tax=Oryza sativa subsp. indica TaxID=39946 RepID=A2XT62_ORYSI|nr:hypothetical protein OsI_15800 [Oryza sativa Indica Group]
MSSPAAPFPPLWRRRPRRLPPIWRRSPSPPVAMVFGPVAMQRYGPDMTLREALDGRGDIYRTLLREATAALLNAYYNAPGVAASPYVAAVADTALARRRRLALPQRGSRRALAAGWWLMGTLTWSRLLRKKNMEQKSCLVVISSVAATFPWSSLAWFSWKRTEEQNNCVDDAPVVASTGALVATETDKAGAVGAPPGTVVASRLVAQGPTVAGPEPNAPGMAPPGWD